MGALTYSIKEIIMTTITIKSVSFNAATSTLTAVGSDNVRYAHVQKMNPCKGNLVLLKVKAAGVINTQYWNVVKSQIMVLAHKLARFLFVYDAAPDYQAALRHALSCVMSDVANITDAIETNGIQWASEYVLDGMRGTEEYPAQPDIAMYERVYEGADAQASIRAHSDSYTPTLQDVQQFPVLTDAEWDMIENKGNPEFCNYTLDEVMSEPVVDSIAPAVVKEEEVECPTINLVPANPVDTPVKVKAPLVSHINHAAMPRALEIIAEVQAKLAAQSK